MKQPIYFASLLLCLPVPGICKGADDSCVPTGATIAEVRALPGLPGTGVVDSFAFYEGLPVVIVNGAAWTQDPETCEWSFMLKLYDPAFFVENYLMQDGQWYRRQDSGDPILLSTEFSDDFDSGTTVTDLIQMDGSRYTSFALLSPLAPTIQEYNALRDCLVAGTCDFLDNRIDFDPTAGRRGSPSLRLYSVAPTPEMVTAKSMVERGMFFFRKGDSVWFSGWFKSEGALPFTLLDLETTWIDKWPGFRITLRDGRLGAELKWLDKPQYLQQQDSAIPFPPDRWVNVRIHVLFSEDEFGKIEIWQDGVRVINQSGRTLPTADSVIDSMQVGITATPQETILHIDDLQVSATRIPQAPVHRNP